MSLFVQKYGGTSVGSIERIQHVASKVKATWEQGHQVVVVVSAMSGETNRLMELASSITSTPAPRELDMLLSTGEQASIALLAISLHHLGCPVVSYTGAQVRIHTDQAYGKARITAIDTDKIRQNLATKHIVIVAGFQGMDAEGNITTLGRGGSDTSAVALAVALKAEECQIYTDVDGVYTTDPRVVPKARRMDRITFEEMLEMASLGSKVLQIRSVEFAGKYQVPLRVLSSFQPGAGTLITMEETKDQSMEQPMISGIAFNRDEAKITLLGIPDTPGIAAEILTSVSDANIEVDMIVQNVSKEQTTDFTFTVHEQDCQAVKSLLQKTVQHIGARDLIVDQRIVKVSLVGVGMRSHAGVASKMFATLAKESINIQMISTSEIKISVVIDQKYLELAVRALHTAFDLDAVD